MGIKNSFAKVPNNRLTRNFGGTVGGVADPYVTGYHFMYMTKIPTKLPDYAGLDTATIQNLLAGACLSVTPPGGTLNKVEFTGLGGIKWSVPANIDYGNSVSVKFLEFNGVPILNIMHGWIKMMRDYRTGTTDHRVQVIQRVHMQLLCITGLQHLMQKPLSTMRATMVYFQQKIHKTCSQVMLKLWEDLIQRSSLMLIIFGMKIGLKKNVNR